jgi:hypothetical protein
MRWDKGIAYREQGMQEAKGCGANMFGAESGSSLTWSLDRNAPTRTLPRPACLTRE